MTSHWSGHGLTSWDFCYGTALPPEQCCMNIIWLQSSNVCPDTRLCVVIYVRSSYNTCNYVVSYIICVDYSYVKMMQVLSTYLLVYVVKQVTLISCHPMKSPTRKHHPISIELLLPITYVCTYTCVAKDVSRMMQPIKTPSCVAMSWWGDSNFLPSDETSHIAT